LSHQSLLISTDFLLIINVIGAGCLHYAASSGKVDLAKTLIETYKLEVNKRDEDGKK